MPFRHISTDLKERAVHLLSEGWFREDVKEIFGVSDSSLYRWRRNIELYGTVDPPRNPVQGRPRSLTGPQAHAVLSYLDENASHYLDEVMEWLAVEHDAMISRTTLYTTLREVGYTYKILRRRAMERSEERRSEFRALRSTYLTARMCVCVDESSKDDRTIYRHYGWAPSGQRAAIDAQFVRGTRWSILPALALDGYIALRIVEGSVDGLEFFDFIVNDVLPQMSPYPGDRSVLILDNCAIHKSDALREAVEATGVLLLFLPPYSPDYNPIEESFFSVKAWIRRHYVQFQNSAFPKQDLEEACLTITPEKAREFFVHAGYDL